MTDDTPESPPTDPAPQSAASEAAPEASLPVSAFVIGFVVLAAICGGTYWFMNRPDPVQLEASVERAFNRGEYDEAYRLAEEAWEASESNRLARVAGECAQRDERLDDALTWYRRLKDDDSEDYLVGTFARALLCINTGRLREAEEAFGKAVEKEPENVEFRRSFGQLLNAEGRRWEASEQFFGAVRHGVFAGETTMEDLLLLANFEAPFQHSPITDKAIEAMPDDPIPLLGTVLTHYIFNRYDEGMKVCRDIIAKAPEEAQAQMWLGRGLIDSDQLAAVPDWNASVPESASEFPGIWHIRGVWAEKVGQKKAAARCFWEAVRREPNYIGANYQLGLALMAIGEKAKAKQFLERHALLSQYHQICHPIYTEGPRLESLKKLVTLADKLGRQWEQFAWLKFAMTHAQQNNQQREFVAMQPKYRDLGQKLQDTMPPRTLSSSNPALAVDLSAYPLPDWSRGATDSGQTTRQQPLAVIRFEDIAADVGLDFTYFNSADRNTKGMRIFESTGGGVAACDFDLDGWSDLYFTQGAKWPVNRDEAVEEDKLFRNLEGSKVADVTDAAGLGDLNYSQGINVGDVDGDGFPDLYLANIGLNRLFRNNGDGTFSEMSQGVADRTRRWTSSALVADLNGDGLPDLFDVNYLSGDEVYDKLCGAEVKRACAPSTFAGEQDEIFLNNGDGTFTNATEVTELKGHRGKGLGVVAADFDGTGRLNVFVANDGIANDYYVPEGDGNSLKLLESAQERGLAFDYDSRGQACMGVAVDDYNGNQTLDLFVTNYFEDSNTLYEMTDAGNLFEDKTRERKLRTPSFDFLGFGTQFLDADLDGRPDIVLTNGHIDDFTHEDKPFRMRPQFYANVGDEFLEIKPPSDSKYMNQQQLGRGLARIDFNRDGRCDFAVTHLDTPAAIAKNTTETDANWLMLRLVGTESARDAIGTTVTLTSKNGSRTMQLTAGDGYQACNERKLNFGLGKADRISRVVVQWPSGVRQTLTNVPVGSEVTVREDDNTVYVIPK